MKLLELFFIAAASVIVCKAIGLAAILFLMWCKGKRFHFDPKQWDAWFSAADAAKLMRIWMVIYLFSATVASFAAWGIMHLLHFRYAAELAVVLFAARIVLTWIRYQKSGKTYFASRMEQLRQTTAKPDGE